MSDFILEYDILESIAKNSNSLGKRSEEYAEQLESKIINAIGNVTGPSSGYLTNASDSVRDKIDALKLKSEAFYRFAEQILNLLEVAEQIDQEVADAIAAEREYFLEYHESLRIGDWKTKLLGLYVDMKNSIPLLGEIADILGGLDVIFECLKDSIKHWYECEGGKYIVEVIKSVVEVGVAIGFLALAVLALSLPGVAVFAVCGVIGAGIGIVNAVTNVATSFRAADAAIDGNPAWAMIYGKQDRLSDVLRQANFGNGIVNDLSNLGARAIDITETVCVIVGFAEAGAGVVRLFKGDAFKLLKNKGALKFSDLKSGFKNGILDLKSSIKGASKTAENIIEDSGYKKTNFEAENPMFGSDWNDYFKNKYDTENVEWLSETVNDVSRLKNTENFKSGALNHILEGELNARGKAVGFHYEGMPSQKGSIITGTETTPNSHGVYEAMVEVNGVVKNGKSSFFPKDYSPQEIINAINEAYDNKQLISGNKFSGISAEGIEIQMYIDSSGNIISAFPIY